ncbi:MAG: cupin domain-containing protein, partial [Bdellovibrionota bacterium]
MIQRLFPSKRDGEAFTKMQVRPADIADNFFDYSKVVVRKPWGYEYLIFQNAFVAVWILYLKPGAKTSMHSHPNKTTSLVVIEGKVRCSGFEHAYELSAGGGVFIEKEAFHRTEALSERGAFVM